jgi:hypothetical protein
MGNLIRFQRSKLGTDAIVLAVSTVLCVALMFCGRYLVCFRGSQPRMVTQSRAILAIGEV